MKTLLLIISMGLMLCVCSPCIRAQTSVPNNPPEPVNVSSENGVTHAGQKKGSFFITPFYEFTSFKKLKLISNTNYYKLETGAGTYISSQAEIKMYNDNYGTEHSNSMTGIKLGYQLTTGLGVSGYAGINHFSFKSWVSDENTQTISTRYPALTYGLAVDYEKSITGKLAAMAIGSYNYCSTGTVHVDNNTGSNITTSSLKSMYWDMNLVLAYSCKKLLPYAGIGFTQQFVHSVHEEIIPTTNDLGEDVTDFIEYDTHYRGSAFYGFAGLSYRFAHNLEVYARSSFLNPIRADVGLRISL